MNLNNLIRMSLKVIKDNSPTILTVFGVSGTITTAYLTGRASFAAANIIRDHEDYHGKAEDPKQRAKERTALVWKLYIPAAISGASTIFSIISATRIGIRKTAAVTAAYSLTERAFTEYRDKVVEKFGEGKERAMRDELAQERVLNNPPKEVIVTNYGHILCHEAFTGRYFYTDYETLRKAENELNKRLISFNYAYLDDFYDLVGLPPTSISGTVGWEVGKLMELKITSVLSPENKPSISFEYNYTRPI